MTTSEDNRPPDPSKAEVYDYRVVFDDPAPPKEAQFTAVNDEEAVDLAKQEYPSHHWTLYRDGEGEHICICTHGRR